VTVTGSVAVLVYAPVAFPAANLTAPGALSLRLYNNDAPPTTMLVTALLKTYATPSMSTQESVFQDTLTVGTLP
jgi:hypothetical protein